VSKLRPHLRPRDNQRSKVYAWERRAAGPEFWKIVFERADDAWLWLKPIWRKERGRVGRAGVVAPEVLRPSWGQTNALAHPSQHKITLPVWARTKWVVLHEAAHLLNRGHESHGPRFVGILMGLASRHLGYDAAQLMRVADEMGVKYHVRSIGVVPTHGPATYLRKALGAHEPMTAMDLACWISLGEGHDINVKQVRAAAMVLIKAGEARWLRHKLVPVKESPRALLG